MLGIVVQKYEHQRAPVWQRLARDLGIDAVQPQELGAAFSPNARFMRGASVTIR
jgi:hypothetical protein